VNDPTGLAGRPEGALEAARSAPPGSRSAEEIRHDIVRQREELSRSVDALRSRVAELTDWRRQFREHRREIVVAGAIAGFAVGAMFALRRRR
jgi:Protein of unknown function (DUF3618)